MPAMLQGRDIFLRNLAFAKQNVTSFRLSLPERSCENWSWHANLSPTPDADEGITS
jgi:hypothetical protein